MSFKRIKIITLVTTYCIFLLLLFSETFISDFQEVRRNVILNTKNNLSETLIIPISEWESISNKKEFNYKNTFYDIKSISYQNNNVKVIAIKDKLERTLTFLSKNLHSKNKKNQPAKSKKSIVLYCHSLDSNTLVKNHVNKIQPVVYNNLYKNNYSLTLFRPPSFA
jgi:hypothetical protein